MTRTLRTGRTAKISLALAAAGALIFGGVTSAYAADIHLGPDDIAAFENGDETQVGAGYNYDQWHIGSTTDAGATLDQSVTFNECSISTLAHPNPGSVVQVLSGFPIDGRPTAGPATVGGDGTTAPFAALVNSTSIEVLQGSVTLQIPVFVYDGISVAGTGPIAFSTIRTVALGPGTYNLADLELTDSTGWTSFLGTNWTDIYAELQHDIDDDYFFEILGVGFTGSDGAEVGAISFAGDTYTFGTGSCGVTPAPGPKPPVTVQTAAR